MMKLRTIGTTIVLCLLSATICIGQMLNDRPNVLIILLDDVGYNDFGFMGSKDISTPNIDALAKEGVLFTNAHVTSSVGAPSRAAILTGRYQQRSGFECNNADNHGLNPEIVTLAELFQEEGYHTAAIGKWHLGIEDQYHPNERGFNEFYGFLGDQRSYFANNKNDAATSKATMLQHNGEQITPKQYLTYEFGDKAQQYIKECGSDPFMIYLAFNAIQAPVEATKEDLNRFKDHPRQTLAAATYALDKAIGGVVNVLKSEDKFDNTIIFFLSDNGGAHDNQSSNAPLKGFKGSKYYGGVRVPMFVTYKGRVSGGVTYDELCSSLDIFATVIAAAEIEYYNPKAPLDGVDLLPYVEGKRGKKIPHEALFWRKNQAKAVVSGDYKLIEIEGVGERLYHITRNPQEDEDIAADSVDQVKQLKVLLNEWESKLVKPLWSEGALEAVTKQLHQELMDNREAKTFTTKDLK